MAFPAVHDEFRTAAVEALRHPEHARLADSNASDPSESRLVVTPHDLAYCHTSTRASHAASA